jgi:hypothetical protein
MRFLYEALATTAATVASTTPIVAATPVATTAAIVATAVVPPVGRWYVARTTIVAGTAINPRTIIAIATISGITYGTANIYARRAAAKEQPESEDAKQGNQRFYTHD